MKNNLNRGKNFAYSKLTNAFGLGQRYWHAWGPCNLENKIARVIHPNCEMEHFTQQGVMPQT